MSNLRRRSRACVATLALIWVQGCIALTYQDAKLVGKGKVEVTPAVTRVGVSEGGENEAFGTALGAMVTAGVSDKVDLSVGYVRFNPKGADEGVNYAGLGPKISLSKDRAALLLPISFAFGNDVDLSESIAVSPTAIFSVPLGNQVTFNPGAKAVWYNCSGCDLQLGAQAGLSIRLGTGNVILRPEAGALFDPGESGFLWGFGLGVSLRPR